MPHMVRVMDTQLHEAQKDLRQFNTERSALRYITSKLSKVKERISNAAKVSGPIQGRPVGFSVKTLQARRERGDTFNANKKMSRTLHSASCSLQIDITFPTKKGERVHHQ